MQEQGAQDRPGEHRHGHRGRSADHQHQTQRPVEVMGKGGGIGLGVFLGQAGQDHRGQGDAKHPQRQLHDPVRDIKPGDTAGDQERGDDGVEQQIDLHHGGTDDTRQHQAHDLAYPLVLPAPAWPA